VRHNNNSFSNRNFFNNRELDLSEIINFFGSMFDNIFIFDPNCNSTQDGPRGTPIGMAHAQIGRKEERIVNIGKEKKPFPQFEPQDTPDISTIPIINSTGTPEDPTTDMPTTVTISEEDTFDEPTPFSDDPQSVQNTQAMPSIASIPSIPAYSYLRPKQEVGGKRRKRRTIKNKKRKIRTRKGRTRKGKTRKNKKRI
jgi:hypothetical protein